MNLEQLKLDIRGYVASAQSDLKEDDFLIFVDEEPLQSYVGASTKVDYTYVFGSHGYGLNKDDYFPDLDDVEEEIGEAADNELADFIQKLYDEASEVDTESKGNHCVYANNLYGYHRTVSKNLSLEAATNLAKELDRQAWKLWHDQSVAHNDDYQVRDSKGNIVFSCSEGGCS